MEQTRATNNTCLRAHQTARILQLRQQKSRLRLRLEGLDQTAWRRGYLRFWQRARQRHLVARLEWRRTLDRHLLPTMR